MSARTDARADLDARRQQLRSQSSFTAKKDRTIYSTQARQAREIEATKKAVATGSATSTSTTTTSRTKEIKITAASKVMPIYVPNGLYYSVDIKFALARNPDPILRNVTSPLLTDQEKEDWGTGFGNPLVNPKRNCVYVVRAMISQLRVDPLIGGFKLQWVRPTNWIVADGQPLTMYVEATSNPLYVARKFRSPVTAPKNCVFRCLVMERYL